MASDTKKGQIITGTRILTDWLLCALEYFLPNDHVSACIRQPGIGILELF